MTSTTLRNLAALSTTALIVGGLALSAAPAAQAAQPDMVVYFDRTFREVIDVGVTGDSHGDITVTNGGLTSSAGGKSVGTYTTSQITAMMSIPGGPQNRKTDMSLMLGKGAIYTTALIAANGGTPPTKVTVHAIIGGTGKYVGASGELTLKPLSATRYKATLHFVR